MTIDIRAVRQAILRTFLEEMPKKTAEEAFSCAGDFSLNRRLSRALEKGGN